MNQKNLFSLVLVSSAFFACGKTKMNESPKEPVSQEGDAVGKESISMDFTLPEIKKNELQAHALQLADDDNMGIPMEHEDKNVKFVGTCIEEAKIKNDAEKLVMRFHIAVPDIYAAQLAKLDNVKPELKRHLSGVISQGEIEFPAGCKKVKVGVVGLIGEHSYQLFSKLMLKQVDSGVSKALYKGRSESFVPSEKSVVLQMNRVEECFAVGQKVDVVFSDKKIVPIHSEYCTEVNAPVCGEVEVNGATVQKTFGNMCKLDAGDAGYLYDGACEE